jgi:hypothetical protein
MNMKKLFCLAIAASICHQAYAFEIHHGKLLNTKTWTTNGGLKAKFIAGKGKKSLLMNRREEVNFQVIDAFVMSGATTVATPTLISNGYGIGVGNDTNDLSTYIYTTSICSATSDGYTHCLYQSNTFELQRGGYFRDNSTADLTMIYDTPGIYTITAGTSLTQVTEGGYTMPATSMATGYVTVTE